MSKKVENNENHMTFALTTDTLSIKKFPTNSEGEIINSEFNAKTYTKKAYAAYLKGKTYFTYKGKVYIVPKMNKSEHNALLEAVTDEGKILPQNNIGYVEEESNNELKNIEQWL